VNPSGSIAGLADKTNDSRGHDLFKVSSSVTYP
jgi:hypothetical protein